MRAPCICGCGRDGGGRSGYARVCYKRLSRRQFAFRAHAATELSLYAAVNALAGMGRRGDLGPVEREALAAATRLLAEFLAGRIEVHRWRGEILARRIGMRAAAHGAQ